MTPHDSPLLIWVGNSEQPARRETDHFRFILRTVGADPVRLTKMAASKNSLDLGARILHHCTSAGPCFMSPSCLSRNIFLKTKRNVLILNQWDLEVKLYYIYTDVRKKSNYKYKFTNLNTHTHTHTHTHTERLDSLSSHFAYISQCLCSEMHCCVFPHLPIWCLFCHCE